MTSFPRSATNIPPPPVNEELQNQIEEVEPEEDILSEREPGENLPAEPQQTSAKETRNRPLRGADKLIRYMKDKGEKRAQIVPNEVDLFFASVSQSVQRLPRFLQTRVKRDVLDSIARAEEEEEFSRMRQPGPSSYLPRTLSVECSGTSRPPHQISPSISSPSNSSRPARSVSPLQNFQTFFSAYNSEQTSTPDSFTYQEM